MLAGIGPADEPADIAALLGALGDDTDDEQDEPEPDAIAVREIVGRIASELLTGRPAYIPPSLPVRYTEHLADAMTHVGALYRHMRLSNPTAPSIEVFAAHCAALHFSREGTDD